MKRRSFFKRIFSGIGFASVVGCCGDLIASSGSVPVKTGLKFKQFVFADRDYGYKKAIGVDFGGPGMRYAVEINKGDSQGIVAERLRHLAYKIELL